MFKITDSTQQVVALVPNCTIEDGGVWCWMGFFESATAVEITVGLVLNDWMIWNEKVNPQHERRNWTVKRVNRVSITVEDENGNTAKIEIR